MNEHIEALIRLRLGSIQPQSVRYGELASAVSTLVGKYRWGFGIGSIYGGGGPSFDTGSDDGLFGFAVWSGYHCLVAHDGENGLGMNLWVHSNVPFPNSETPSWQNDQLAAAREERAQRKGVFQQTSVEELACLDQVAELALRLAEGTQWRPHLIYRSSRSSSRS